MTYHHAQTYMLKVNKLRKRLIGPKSHDQYHIFEKSMNSLMEKSLKPQENVAASGSDNSL